MFYGAFRRTFIYPFHFVVFLPYFMFPLLVFISFSPRPSPQGQLRRGDRLQRERPDAGRLLPDRGGALHPAGGPEAGAHLLGGDALGQPQRVAAHGQEVQHVLLRRYLAAAACQRPTVLDFNSPPSVHAMPSKVSC